MISRNRFLPAVFLWTLISISCLGGCATVDQKINLSYAPLDRSLGRCNTDIAVSRLETRPQHRNSKGEWIVGSLNNVHGVHQADILADISFAEWVTDALLLELKRAGCTVTYTGVLPATAPRGIVISDLNIFMNIDKGTVTDKTRHELKFNIDAFLNGTRIKTFTVVSRDNSTLISASKEHKEKIMVQSLQDAMQQIAPEILALIEKK